MPRKIVRRRRVRRNPATVSTNPRRRVRRNPRARRTINVRSKRAVRHVAGLERMGYSSGSAIRMAAAAAKRSKRRKPAKKHGRSYASYVAAGKKAARTRARHATSSVAPRRRRKTRKAAVTSRRRRKSRLVTVLHVRKSTRNRRRGPLTIRRYTKGSRFIYRSRLKRNPLNAMKSMIMDGAALYGGYVGSRIIGGLLQEYVLSKITALQTPDMLKVKTLIPSALTFVLAAFAGKVLPNQPKVVSAIQTGATLNLLITAIKTFVVPNLGTMATSAPWLAGALQGIDDMGFRGYGYGGYGQIGEYIQQRPDLGAYVQEAMALDEYVQDGGGMHGFDVQEALADSEVQGMQSGFAAGSLARTTFAV